MSKQKQLVDKKDKRDDEQRFWGKVARFNISTIAKILSEAISEDSKIGAGGTVIFLGHVKGSVDGHIVNELVYEVYEPHATKILDSIAKQQAQDPQVTRTVILHNWGNLRPGDPTVLIIVTAKSREIAFKTARNVLERVKKEPPIFKLEKRDDGNYWIIGDGKRIREEKPKSD